MDRTERFYKIDQLLQERQAVPLEAMIEALGVSRATVVRDLEYLRDRLAAPIVWDRERRGYRYEARGKGGPCYALPGLWLNASEAHALLTMEQLLANLQPGLLGPHIEPLERRAKDVAEKTLNAQLGAGYGIFGGEPTHTVVLRFTPARARWVARERWHPEQQGAFDAEGYYVLSVPYADATELVMDVLRHGTAVRERLRQARAVYGD